MGYERMIGTLKREMAKMLGYTVLTYFELDLHLKEVMGIINNRPLTVDNSNEVISPNNILTGSNNTDNNILEVKDTQEILKQAMIKRIDYHSYLKMQKQKERSSGSDSRNNI